MMRVMRSFITAMALLAATMNGASAFTVSSPIRTTGLNTATSIKTTSDRVHANSNSELSMARRWNFNEARGPWGMKNNAEIWNGRVAQMGFVVILLQELITGKGVIQGLQDGDAFSFIMVGATVLSVAGLTGWLAYKGKEDDIIFDRDYVE
eukprot:CAMPEP_0195525328 /NCGR_PEP_ID=MMETSP0794_2-20130614/25738_1 /TAXON_ID=515487 /ORGANISM="Stephanopyxis turris, Strain CCMP 815" /LENGTH=150 /DNA_ID=CAMNT_0040655771 /DNA_START=90 /DNA_END=542 /DNA_ORIENTATION=+